MKNVLGNSERFLVKLFKCQTLVTDNIELGEVMRILKKSKALLFFSSVVSGIFVIVLAFQNCSPPVQFQLSEEQLASSLTPNNPGDDIAEIPMCSFDGRTYQEGESVTDRKSVV